MNTKQKKDFAKRAVRHGECLLKPIQENDIPAEAVEIFNGKQYTAAHSETGHHHVVFGDVAVLTAGGRTFLRANKNSRLEHLKTFDRHETKPIFKGLYEVILKKEYDYFAKVIREVRD